MKTFTLSTLCIISVGAVAVGLDPGLKNELVSDFCSAPHPATVYVPEVVTPFAPSVAVAPKVAQPAPVAAALPIKVWQAPSPIPTRDHWTWTVGANTYADVSIVRIEPDVVTIMHSTGGGEIDIAKLSPDVQAMLNYDPATAALARSARVKADATSRVAIAQETALEQAQVERMQAQVDANRAACNTAAAERQAEMDATLAEIASLRQRADAAGRGNENQATDLRRQADKLAASLAAN